MRGYLFGGSSVVGGAIHHFELVHAENLRSCFQFWCACYAAEAHVGSHVAVSRRPLRYLDRFEDVLAQTFARNSVIVSFDKGVLLRDDWLDVFKWDAVFLGRCHQVTIDIF